MDSWRMEQVVPAWDCFRSVAFQDRSASTFQAVCPEYSEGCRNDFIDNVTLDPTRLVELKIIPRAWLRAAWRHAIIYGNIRADYYATLSIASPEGGWSAEVCDRIPPVGIDETKTIVDNKLTFPACLPPSGEQN